MRTLTPLLLVMLIGCVQTPLIETGPHNPLDVAAILCLDQAWEVEQQVEVGGTILRSVKNELECSPLTLGRKNSVSIPMFWGTFAAFIHGDHSLRLPHINRSV